MAYRSTESNQMALEANRVPYFARVAHDEKIHSIWALFFKSDEWLEKAYKNLTPPVLVGSFLQDIWQDNIVPWRRGHLVLICQGIVDPELFKRCLQPHALHSHGRVVQLDYAFESHNITLNAECASTGTIVHSVYTRWPERLSGVSGRGRHSAYLVWGEMVVKCTRDVFGLGKNIESSESVSRICSIKLQGHKDNMECVFCRHPCWLFAYDSTQSCYRYGNDYERGYRTYIQEIIRRTGPALQKCEACSMKGDETGEIY